MEEERNPNSIFSTPHPSALFKDISNLKTLNRLSQLTPHSLFFTASKKTPNSSSFNTRNTSVRRKTPSQNKAIRRFKAFELEQSVSSRKAQIKKEKTLNCLEKSLTAWLNFLFNNPLSCGCNVEERTEERRVPTPKGKRDSLSKEKFEIGYRGWRDPKRRKSKVGKAASKIELKEAELVLRVLMKDVCSFEDLKERLGMYMSNEDRTDVLVTMSHIAKAIDDGRLRMKAHCPITTDLAMRENAVKVLMSYNMTWLQIGMHIVFGGDSILPNNSTFDTDSDDHGDDLFMKLIVDRQIFTQPSLAKAYAYNKSVEGNYRPGYYEALGAVVLKRFLLFVLSLDKAKHYSALPIRYGIDGVDGGSPLLFRHHATIKSSRKVVLDFLMETMHGEGDLLGHLSTLGYKLFYQQSSLSEYNFKVDNLLEDVRDGVLLCRAVQLLHQDTSILEKLVVPSDTRKKNLSNCSLAFQYLKQIGVPLTDDDGDLITVEDIVNGDKELTINLLWNVFAHLQLPYLVPKARLLEELSQIDNGSLNSIGDWKGTHLDMLLEWIQAISGNYSLRDGSASSLVDGRVLIHVLEHLMKKALTSPSQQGEEISPLRIDCNATNPVENFELIQKVAKVLGDIPEVLQLSDVMEEELSSVQRSVVMLAVFLIAQLIGQKSMEQMKIQKVLRLIAGNSKQASTESFYEPEMQERSIQNDLLVIVEKGMFITQDGQTDSTPVTVQRKMRSPLDDVSQIDNSQLINQQNMDAILDKHVQVDNTVAKEEEKSILSEDKAKEIMKSHLMCILERRKFVKIKHSTSFLQMVVRAWLDSKNMRNEADVTAKIKQLEKYQWYYRYMSERRIFLRTRESALTIQRAIREWLARKHCQETLLISGECSVRLLNNGDLCICMEKIEEAECHHQSKHAAAAKIQTAWKKFRRNVISRKCYVGAIEIQKCWRGYQVRRDMKLQSFAAVRIQSIVRTTKYMKALHLKKKTAITIQQFVRKQIAKNLLDELICQKKQSSDLLERQLRSTIVVQRWWKKIYAQRLRVKSAVCIQSHVRGWLARRHLKNALAALVIQKWWRDLVVRKEKERSVTVTVIQSHVRGWIARKKLSRMKHNILVIQSHWKGCIARRRLHQKSREQLLDLRNRMQISAANAEDKKRLMNRLIDANHTLNELLNSKKLTGMLHACATLDTATLHSQKCCETLVEAGAISSLVQIMHTGNRSLPYLEVMKHTISTLRNLARYPHILDVLIETHGLIETAFEELLRSKDDGYFIAAELLRKICNVKKGVLAVCKLVFHVKRLQILVDKLRREVAYEKRQSRRGSLKSNAEKRLKEAEEVLQFMKTRCTVGLKQAEELL